VKTFIVGVALVCIAVLGVWAWGYQVYDIAQREAGESYRQGDAVGMRDRLVEYESSRAAYPLRFARYLEKFKQRFIYAKGVAYAGLGDSAKAEIAFRDAATAHEARIAEWALYNGASYLVFRNELDAARDAYRKSLILDPFDVQAKINLELLLKKIQERNAAADALKKKNGQGQAPAPGDYWKREIPSQDNPGGGSSNRIYH